MKKILILLWFVFLCLTTFSQTGNDTTKYTWYRFNYGEKFNRIWGLNVLDLPSDTVYSKWGIARKGAVGYIGNGNLWTAMNRNIYTFDDQVTSDRTVNQLGHQMNFIGTTAAIFNSKLTSANGDYTQIANFGTVAYMKSAGYIGTRYGVIAVDSTNVAWGQTEGSYQFQFLVQANDSTTFKPLAANSSGFVKRMDGWPGGGGGGSADVVTTITSGTSSTVPNGTNIIRFNSTGVLTYTLTLPTTWHTSNDLLIAFTSNGTITNGNLMVNLTVVNGSGHTLSYAVNPTGSYNAGENLGFKLISTIEQRVAK